MFADSLYLPHFRVLYDVAEPIWFDYLGQDAAYLYTALFVSQAYVEFVRGERFSRQTAALLANALPMLQANLDNPSAATTDTTISVILSLAMAADLYGDLESAKKHVHGLHKVVMLRGGVAKLNNIQLQIKCCRSVFPQI